MSDAYDVLPIPTHVGSIINKNNLRLKPFVAVYFPAEILTKMGWTKSTRLQLSIEKEHLKITQTDAEQEELYFDLNELTYGPPDEYGA